MVSSLSCDRYPEFRSEKAQGKTTYSFTIVATVLAIPVSSRGVGIAPLLVVHGQVGVRSNLSVAGDLVSGQQCGGVTWNSRIGLVSSMSVQVDGVGGADLAHGGEGRRPARSSSGASHGS